MIRELEELAKRAGPAIENARRFREARQLADLDALTGLHNRRYFHETLAREVARAQRYDRQLALIVFDLDDFKAINDRIGHLAGDAVLGRDGRARARRRALGRHRLPRRRRRVRGDPARVVDRRRRPALPPPARRGLLAARRPGRAAVRSRPGSPSSEPTTTRRRFFERADEALYRAKELGKGQVVRGRRAGPRRPRRTRSVSSARNGR